MIELCGVTQHYGVRPVLRQVDLRIEAAELTAIVGPNGMGKSTLLSVVAGVLSPQKGHVEIDGLRRRRTEAEELEIRRRVAYLPDHPWLPVNQTGREFLLGVGRLYDVETESLFDHVDRLLQLFDLRREGDWPIRSYSNGQKKKIAICSALVTDASVLLLDEPFAGGLDPAGILALKRVLARIAKRAERTVVMTAPAPELVEEMGEKIIILCEGTVVAHDTLDGLRRQASGATSLEEILATLIHPETLHNIETYFEPDTHPTRLGWPYCQLSGYVEPPMTSRFDRVAISLLAGWLLFALAARPDLTGGDRFEGVLMFVGWGTIACVFGRLAHYCGTHWPPISLWGRFRTGRWMVPGYDKVFIPPLVTAVTGWGGLVLVATFADGSGPWFAPACGVLWASTLMITTLMGPSHQCWRLTATARIGNTATGANRLFEKI